MTAQLEYFMLTGPYNYYSDELGESLAYSDSFVEVV